MTFDLGFHWQISLEYHAGGLFFLGSVLNSQPLALLGLGFGVYSMGMLRWKDGTYRYFGQHVAIVSPPPPVPVWLCPAITHPLGHTPGEKYMDGAHPEGRHSVELNGPRCSHVRELLFVCHNSFKHALGGVKVVVSGGV